MVLCRPIVCNLREEHAQPTLTLDEPTRPELGDALNSLENPNRKS